MLAVMDEAQMRRLLTGVDGFLHSDEAIALHEAVRQLDVEPIRIVELGAALGRSAIAAGSALQERGEGEMHSVDFFNGANLETFTANIESRDLRPLVHTWQGSTHEVRARWDRGQIGMLFVDASHEYDDVSQDVEDWQPLLVPGAAVVFNDASLPGVYRMLRERVFSTGSAYQATSLVRSTLFTRYLPGSSLAGQELRRHERIFRMLRTRRLLDPLVDSTPTSVKRLGNAMSNRLANRATRRP